MDETEINITIVNYPGSMQSAVQGIKEMFLLVNSICEQRGIQRHFSTNIYEIKNIEELPKRNSENNSSLEVIFIPPDLEGYYHQNPDQSLKDWLKKHHEKGAIICSACAGSFILADAGLLHQREVTTHWDLAENFSKKYPEINLNSNKILIHDGNIITAGGLMSWLDLGLELIAQLTDPNIMRQLGKYLVIDTGQREQRYYVSFSPKLDHGDKKILKTQKFMQENLSSLITLTTLSELCFLTKRTFLRRFAKVTGVTPIQYLQKLRIQKACELIETTNQTIDAISFRAGYGDTSAFRKIFIKIMGLTPGEFKKRFVSDINKK